MKKNLAFTLAETLIVIAIIGVVAALTLPNLNSSTADKEKVTKVKKVYAALTEATDRAVAVYGPIDGWFNGLSEEEAALRAKDRITEFMKVSKDCGTGTGCWSTDASKFIDGEEFFEDMYDALNSLNYSFVNLADGVSLAVHAGYTDDKDAFIGFYVDIDGPNKGKTVYGNDVFDFYMEDSTKCGGPRGQLTPNSCPDDWTGNSIKYYETAWIINNDNADYLKATCSATGCVCPNGGKLNWETKTSCN